MNTDEELSEAMARRVAGSGPGVPLEHVIGRAHQIRRRRRMMAAGGVAAAAVVAAIGLSGSISSLLSTGAEPQVTKDATIEPKRTVLDDLDLGALSRGSDAKVTWVEGADTLVFGDRRAQVKVEGSGDFQMLLQSPVRVHQGWLTWVDDGNDGREVLRVDGHGTIVDRWKTALHGPDLSPDGSTVVYDRRGELVRENVDTAEVETLPVAGVVDHVLIDENRFVYYGVRSPGPTADDDGIVERVWGSEGFKKPTKLSPVDVDAEVGFLHLDSASDTGSCSSLRDWAEKSLWQTCDYRLTSFSPDGQWVTAIPAQSDGFGPGDLFILDAATGKPVISVVTHGAPESPTFTSYRWEDDSHLLAVAGEGTAWQLVRMGIDGQVEAAADGTTTEQAYDIAGYRLGPGR